MAGELVNLLSDSFEAHHFDETKTVAALKAMQKSSPALYTLFSQLYGEALNMKKELAGMKSGGGAGGSFKEGDSIADYAQIRKLMNEAVGDMYVAIRRTTNTVVDANNAPVSLPYCLFGLNDYDNNYSTLMGPQLNYLAQIVSTKVTLSLVKVAGGVNFIYTQGNHSDTVFISFIGGITAYTNALNAQNQDFLNWGTKLILYTISDPTNGLAQIQNGFLNFNKVGVSSNQGANVLSVDSRKLSCVFQTDRVELVFPETDMDATTGIVDTIIPVPEEDTYFQIKQNIYQSWKGTKGRPQRRMPESR